MTNGEFGVTGGTAGGETVPKGKRILADLIDLVGIPILLGVVAGLVLIIVPEPLRTVALVLINAAWLVARDAFFSPGRKILGLKLISLAGEKVTILQAVIRNVLLMVPFVLVVGYILEVIFILTKGDRLEDQWAKTKVVKA